MIIAKVLCNAIASIKLPQLHKYKLLVVQVLDHSPGRKSEGGTLLAIDLIGAGQGDEVMLLTGSQVNLAAGEVPADAAVIGILERVNVP